MVTTLKINNLSDIKGDFISKVLREMFASFGEIEIIIKPKKENVKTEIFRRIADVENGAELLYFNESEFNELNKKLLSGISPDKTKIKKIRKHATNHLLSE